MESTKIAAKETPSVPRAQYPRRPIRGKKQAVLYALLYRRRKELSLSQRVRTAKRRFFLRIQIKTGQGSEREIEKHVAALKNALTFKGRYGRAAPCRRTKSADVFTSAFPFIGQRKFQGAVFSKNAFLQKRKFSLGRGRQPPNGRLKFRVCKKRFL